MDHGVSINEIPTGVVPPVHVTAGLPVYVGVAPINLGDLTAVNKPVLITNLADAVSVLGYVDGQDWSHWTLLEALNAHFVVYGVGPVVCINVIDPNDSMHLGHLITEPQTFDATDSTVVDVYGTTSPLFGILEATVVVKYNGATKILGTDYTLAFNSSGYLVVTRVSTGTIPALGTITVTCTYLDPTGVTSTDIIGGYSGGAWKGIAAVEQVFPRLRLVPGFLLAPTWSEKPVVEAALVAEAHSIDGAFRALALVDLSTAIGDIASPEAAPTWKSTNAYNAIDLVACWPRMKNGASSYHASTVVACVANLTDNANQGIPFASPSNKPAIGTSSVLDDGTEILMTRPQANTLNAAGIVTLLNGFNGWVVWGNRTAIYPADTDPKDAFIPVRRMFNWIENTIILTTDRDVDDPLNRRLIDSVIGTIQAFLNGLVAGPQALVAGKIEFRQDENPTTQLSDGKIIWHVTLTPPSPAEAIEFVVEYDPTALSALFP